VNRLFLPIIAIVVLAGAPCAMAADVSFPAPFGSVAAPPYDWYGFYIGIHAGDARAQNTFSQTPGYQSGTIKSLNGFGGGQIGINNYLTEISWLVGIEADISGTSLSGSTTTTPGDGAEVGWAERLDVFGTLRGRLGYAVNNWLLYGTGGFAWSNSDFTRTQLIQTQTSPLAGNTESTSPTRLGWVAGVGIEWGFFGNWTAKVEYLHLNLSDEIFNFSTVTVTGNMTPRWVDEGRLSIDMVRVGVNYLFR
jgi:opacity protein-like surface antigen